ncbi:TetR/AcrR family transcriptional regulator [Cryobacterium sp. PH31-O1]|uniref:TetR/AcrR family transcriptional regulator n=1 Tax=Cryobacterium sp. PH31-O1 TaxID=3046306 RepID=UPI0024B90127|nr:TetR/AcrR family transcriptional regulator [Cryobacterium sp. PH31-O1]MDJ0338978.1 TetR/AcrR family transcriptional regulator [Cryobacterium sp. PH31-O1]
MRSNQHTDAPASARVTVSAGRRERSKEAKQARIFAAAAELFAEHGYASVTTQQIAERADVANGTLFRYASTKAELLLMVCNDDFRRNLDLGRVSVSADESTATEPARRILTLLTPLIEAGRRGDANTAAYQREILFGEPSERYRAEALVLVADLQNAIAGILSAASAYTSPAAGAPTAARDPTLAARAVSNVLHLELARAALSGTPFTDFIAVLASQIELITRGFLAPGPPG